MGKLIAAVALIGWAIIVAAAWRLAAARIALCYYLDTPCIVRTTAARDYVLIAGLTVALAFALITMIAVAVARARQFSATGWQPTSRAAQPRLR